MNNLSAANYKIRFRFFFFFEREWITVLNPCPPQSLRCLLLIVNIQLGTK